MKLRFILIGILVIVGGYFIYMNMPQEEKIIRENIAREISLQAELTDKISKAENAIKQLQEAISGDNAKIKASVDVLEAYYRINYIKGYGWNPEKDKPSSDTNTGGLQAPSTIQTGVFTCTIDGENMLADKVDDVYNYEYLDTCGVFTDYDGCWIRREDGANCFKK